MGESCASESCEEKGIRPGAAVQAGPADDAGTSRPKQLAPTPYRAYLFLHFYPRCPTRLYYLLLVSCVLTFHLTTYVHNTMEPAVSANGARVIATSYTCLSIAVVFVALRLAVRWKVVGILGREDATLCLALVRQGQLRVCLHKLTMIS